MYDVAIIGGGASGLICAIAAADHSTKAQPKICILERMERVGKKLLSTGNGRCNLTNIHDSVDFFYGENRNLITQSLSCFNAQSAIDFFQRQGLICMTDAEGRVYPHCRQAAAVLDILRNSLRNRGIEEICSFDVEKIQPKGGFFTIYSSDGLPIQAKKVVLATGGQAMKVLGSNGSGFRLAKKLGHSLTKIYPALVKLKTDDPITKSLNGLRVMAAAQAVLDEEPIKAVYGEVQFSDFCLSGIPIMQLSHLFGEKKGRSIMEIRLDLLPEIEEQDLAQMLMARRSSNLFDTLETYLAGILNKKIGFALLKRSGLSPLSIASHTLMDEQIYTIAGHIKKLTFEITGDLSWGNAQVTGGGVNSFEFDSTTLESSLIHGLYACGEILDIFGDCGGYNLQWAWTTGYICGSAIGREMN